MDPNPPTDPTKGTLPHPGSDHHPKTGKNQPQINEKSMMTVFPAKSAEISGKKKKKGGNVSEQTDAPKTNDREDGNKTNTTQQGLKAASERGMAPPPSTSSMAPSTSTSTAGTSTGTRPKTPGRQLNLPSPPRPRKARGPTRSPRTPTSTPTASTRQLLKRRIP